MRYIQIINTRKNFVILDPCSAFFFWRTVPYFTHRYRWSRYTSTL